VAVTGWTKVVSIPIARKNSIPNPVLLLQNFQEMFSYFSLRILALVIGSCHPAENLTCKMLLCGLANVFACRWIEDCIAVIGSDYKICDSLLEQIPTFGELDKMNNMSNR